MDTQQPQEQNTNTVQPTAQAPKQKKKLKTVAILLLSLILIAGSAGAVYFFVLKKDTAQHDSASTQTVDQGALNAVAKESTIPEPKTKMVAVWVDNKGGGIWLVDPATAKYKVMDTSLVACCGGTSYAGGTFMTLPSELQTLVLVKDKGLYILSHEDMKTYQINSIPNIGGIVDISPDSTKAIVYYNFGTMDEIDMSGMSTSAKLTGYDTVGYHMLDIATGKLTSLSHLDKPNMFVGNTKILTIKEYTTSQKQIDLYDLETYQYTKMVVDGEWGFGFGEYQYDFSADGIKWTYMNSKGTESGDMFIRDFPAGVEKSVVSGPWAQNQWPRFSEDASKVYYRSKGALLGQGYNQDDVWQYDVATGQKTKVTEGTFIDQSGDKLLVTVRFADFAKQPQLVIYDTKTGSKVDATLAE